jgi:OmpA-like transmembrane domain
MRYAAIAVALVAAPASSESNERGFYVGADVAGMDVHAGRDYGMLFGSPQGTIPRVVERVLPESATAHSTDVVWGGQFGYRINRFLSIELGYLDFGSFVVSETYDPPPFTQFPGILETDVFFEAAGPSLSLLGRVPFGNRWEGFVRVGVLHADQKVTRSLRAVLPGESGTEHASDDVPVFGMGAACGLSSDWTVRIEYQVIDDLHGSDKIDGISSLGPLRIRRYGLGVTYKF